MKNDITRFGWCGPAALLVAACSGCSYYTAPQETGGTDVAAGPFGRGSVVVSTDYQSTNVSLIGLDGASLSPSFISSSSFLSADVAVPSTPSTGDDVVLLDRVTGLVAWVGVRTGDIRTQLHSDNDGLARNPWDYLPVAADKAYVTRYDPVPGKSPHGDVIVLDPKTATVTSHVDERIDVASALELEDGVIVHPARGIVVGERAYFTTVNATLQYKYSSSFLVALDTKTDKIVATRKLEGLHDCTGIAASPSGDELAVSCAGDLQANAAQAPDAAAIVLVASDTLKENKRFPASSLGGGVPGFSLSYAAERSLLITLLGNVKDGTDDVALQLDLDTDKTREIHRAPAVQIGAVLCPARVDGKAGADTTPPTCFLTDADKGALLRFPVANGKLGEPAAITVNDKDTHRPPRYLGQF